ncbi:MAG: calcineurin-like phosphoesterase C-terminal domain-containing protein [Xanthomonadaceae bacterium]|nr:calcineurin-like phosphoesterase C-terminal domain-containing protein [Xanthomonadaceae bacterium]
MSMRLQVSTVLPVLLLALLAAPVPTAARAMALHRVLVYEDRDGNGRRDDGEPGLAGVKVVLDERSVRTTDADGVVHFPAQGGDRIALIKPPGFALPRRENGLPDFWRAQPGDGPARDAPLDLQFGLRRGDPATRFDVLVFGDPQPKSLTDVDYYRRDIVEPLIGRQSARVGLSLGDIVHDDLSLYPAINAVTARLNVPWLHVAGNHDLNLDAHDDAGSLATFTATFGPDTFAWEEGRLAFVGLDDVIYLPGQQPSYIGGLRPQQFEFLAAYLDTLPAERLVVLALHIPLFNPDPARETFRKRDRERLFALLARFPHVLVLSAHGHVQQHYLHGVDDGWTGAQSLHEYNVGAACGGFWSGVKDAEGIPDTTMADGTPNGYALMRVNGSDYALAWHPARDAHDSQIALHAPKVLRRGAWPGVNVYANVFMAMPDARVEYRIDQRPWQPMKRVREGDPEMLARNLADDASDVLRGFDRAPQASVSSHLWRAPLPTDLALGGHRIQVRSNDRWRGEIGAVAHYRLDEAAP